MWRGYVVEVLSTGSVWVTIPARAGDEPVGPLPSMVSGLTPGQEVVVAATDSLGQELLVLATAQQAAVTWDSLVGKPAAYPPEAHTHPVAQISDSTAVGRSVVTAADAAAARAAIGAGTSNLAIGTTSTTAKAGNYAPTWSQVTSKPTTFPPSAHRHPWADLDGVPATMPPSAHTHPWTEVTDRPAAYPPEAHTHDWTQVTGRPATFPPDAHTHTAAQISDATTTGRSVLTAASAAAARTAIGAGTSSLALGTTSSTAKAGNYVPTWSEVTGKPATFPAEAHTHDAADVASGVLDPARLPAASSTQQGALTPAQWSLLDGATQSAVTGTVAVRESGARLQVGSPTLAYHAATKGYVDPGPWVPLNLANGWTALGGSYATPAYRLTSLGVQFRGPIVPGTLTANICALPSEAWPTTAKLIGVTAWSNQSAPYRLMVSADGRLSMTGLTGSVSWVTLDGIIMDIT